MKTIIIMILVATTFARATPAENAKGKDLANAARIALQLPNQPKDLPSRMTALYMLGFIEGALETDAWYGAMTKERKSLIALPAKMTLADLMKELYNFVGESRVFRDAPAKKVFHAFVSVKYGTSQEVRNIGGKIMFEIIGKEAPKIIEELKKHAEQGAASNLAPVE
jgi:hypothetical protein